MIPGHFRAYTFWLMILMVIVAYSKTSRIWPSIGLALIIVGAFIGDQALHLRQADHSAPPPTSFEAWQQKYFWSAITIGTLIAITGALIAFS